MRLMADQGRIRSTAQTDAIIRTVCAVGLVALIGMILLYLKARPASALLGYAIAVWLAVRISGPKGALFVIGAAALMVAFALPPVHSLAIAPRFRLGYGLFLLLCLLIGCYRLPRNGVPPLRKQTRHEDSREPYTEADLPTIASRREERAVHQKFEVEGSDLYQWDRACAHLSDLAWDAQIKLEEGNTEQAYMLLQYAYELSTQTRDRIRNRLTDQTE